MTTLSEHLEDYLALRRALGYKLVSHGRLLPGFLAQLDAHGESRITVRQAQAWACLATSDAELAHRLSLVRGLAVYLSAFDPATEVPPARLAPGGVGRVTPYLYSTPQLQTLLAAAGRLEPPAWGATMATLIGLLATPGEGMRPGEAYRLDCDQVDLVAGELAVTSSKFAKSRVLPLHPTTVEALRDYRARRDLVARPGEVAMFLSRAGRRRVASAQAAATFRSLLVATAIEAPPGRRPPRLYDLRHSFAVHTLIDWHQAGVDVQARLPVLSAYLGHLVPANTYWYLEAAPELMAVVAGRLAASWEAGL